VRSVPYCPSSGGGPLGSGSLGIVMGWLVRGAAVVLLVAAACSSDGHVDADLSGVDVDEDSIALVAGCFEEAGGDAELRDGQIVVTNLWGEGRIDGDCATAVRLDLAPGPDVVDAEGGERFALVGDSYRQIDYCGVETQRCVPFSALIRSPGAACCRPAGGAAATGIVCWRSAPLGPDLGRSA